jgi:hypothetical protein
MKKLILFFSFIVLSLSIFSQVKASAVSLTIGMRDNSFQKYTWGETKFLENTILVVFKGKDVTVFTEEVQYYQTLQPEKFIEGASWWYAFDEEMKKCKLYLYEGTPMLVIEYDDVCIIYGIVYN